MSSTFFRCAQRAQVSWAIALLILLQPCVVTASTIKPLDSARTHTSARAADIALKQDGALLGQVVDQAGVGVTNAQVLLTNGQQSWQTKTDSKGWFRLTSLRGGTYQFQAAGQTQLVRAWAAGSAPPKASQGLLVTPATDIFRGQRVVSPKTNQFFRVAKHQLAKPLVVTGITLTAVAIPVAIHNTDDDPPATP